MKSSRACISLAVLLSATLAGCATQGTGEPAQLSHSEVASLSYHPPIVSDRFLLDDPEQQMVGEIQIITARHQDTFVDIARAYNLGFDELLDANPDVDPWLPGEGTRIVLPTRFILPKAPRDGIVINLASKRLFYYLGPDEDGALAVITFPIGIGQLQSRTPEGSTTVTMKARDPVWYVPASIRAEYAAEGNPLPAKVLPGPDNPLGSHVLVLAMPSYLIHGTNRPAGVGMRVSHGCIRLFPENIEFLYQQAPVGVPVHIVNQPWLLAWDHDQLYLEAHAPLIDDERDWPAIFTGLLQGQLRQAPNGSADADEKLWRDILNNVWGVPLPVLSKAPDGNAVLEQALLVNNLAIVPEQATEIFAREDHVE